MRRQTARAWRRAQRAYTRVRFVLRTYDSSALPFLCAAANSYTRRCARTCHCVCTCLHCVCLAMPFCVPLFACFFIPHHACLYHTCLPHTHLLHHTHTHLPHTTHLFACTPCLLCLPHLPLHCHALHTHLPFLPPHTHTPHCLPHTLPTPPSHTLPPSHTPQCISAHIPHPYHTPLFAFYLTFLPVPHLQLVVT